MNKDVTVFLKHILDSIESIEKFIDCASEKDFMSDEKLKFAVVRAIEVIGEAVKNIPSSYRNKNPDIPWKDIAGMRDKLMHQYFGVDYSKVWLVVKDDIPLLKKKIIKLLSEEKS